MSAIRTTKVLLVTLAGILGCSDGGGAGGKGGAGGSTGGNGGATTGTGGGAGGTTGTGGGAGGADAGSGGSGGGQGDGAAGSGGADAHDGGGDGGVASTLSPLPAAPPADTTNRFADSAAAATLGQKLFFEKGFSGALAVADNGINGGLGMAGATGKISCASCHIGTALDDRRSNPNNVSLGADFLTRNALPLVNSSDYAWTNWGGRFAAQWELPIGVIENGKNMNGTRLLVAHVVFSKYRAEYEAVVGSALPDAIGTDTTRFPATGKPMAAGGTPGAWEGMTAEDQATVNTIFVNGSKIIAAYLRKLRSGDSRFDDSVKNGTGLTASEARGLEIFAGKANCIACHNGPTFTDNKFHNLGLPQVGPNVPAADNGRFADVTPLVNSALNVNGAFSDDRNTGRLTGLTATPPEEFRGVFRTPSLRNVAASGPYMHAGQLATLEAVVGFYDRITETAAAVGTRDPLLHDLGLTAQEKADLVAFLGTLTSAPLPAALLTDTSAP